MANKLKDNFSNKPIELNMKLTFNEQNTSIAFGEAIETVWLEGKAVKIDGEALIETKIQDGNKTYPYQTPDKKISDIVVAPSKEIIEISLGTTNTQGNSIKLFRYYAKDRIILESLENSSIYFRSEFLIGTNKCNLTVKHQPHVAKRISDIIQQYDEISKLLNFLFVKQDIINDNLQVSNNLANINDVRNAILSAHSLYSKLLAIENILNTSFDPSKIIYNEDLIETISEIYFLIIEKKIVRMKNTFKDFTNQEMSIAENDFDIEEGQTVLLTFIYQIKYKLLGKNIVINTANALINAVVVEVTKEGSIIKGVKYEGKENNPIFVSYSGFISKKEASIEQQKIVEKIKQYEQAKTLHEYFIDEFNVTKK